METKQTEYEYDKAFDEWIAACDRYEASQDLGLDRDVMAELRVAVLAAYDRVAVLAEALR
jgi:hypothetical protein